MADIDALPKEILDSVISFMDDKTKRLSRLASTQWFKQIRYSDFQLNFVRDDQLEAVMTRLSQYHMPISIKFTHYPKKQLAKIVDPLTKLTNLVSLTMGAIELPASTYDWLKMTCLTNLKYLIGSQCEVPMELYRQMTWLRNYNNDNDMSLADARRMVQRLTNLENLIFSVPEATDAFELVKSLSHVTSLKQFHHECKTINEEHTKSLANLKHLHLTWNVGNEEMSLRYMTTLERLDTVAPFHSINSTGLTHLNVHNRALASAIQYHSKLLNLKTLSLTLTHTDLDSFAVALASFTALESLSLDSWTEGCNGIYNLVTSTNLTALELTERQLAVPINLTSIESLILNDVLGEFDCGTLSNLINLTRLELMAQRRNSLPTTLANLKYLSWNVYEDTEPIGLLANLEHLQLYLFGTNQLNGLEYASRLTLLNITSDQYHIIDCGFLKNMTLLEHLDVYGVICQNVWQHMSALNNLSWLQVPQLEREEDVLSLTNMTNLSYFRTIAQGVKGVHLTLLTSLQTLHFLSDVAAETISVDNLYSSLTRLSDHAFKY